MEAFRFPRAARLLTVADFNGLRQGSQRVTSRYFQAQYRITDGTAARMGLAVSRRVSKLAVERNRLKRLTRESFRRHRQHLVPLDILIIPRSSAVPVSSRELLDDLALLWHKLPPLKPQHAAGTMRD
ncbi:ribonuclease P protein component [Tahibacter amnicola]|uniref:Ribonuclease P protein component n=1 Tax=Tahibacter amnicola TaxID=2976241 RepID=A0ABY6BF40_9GAMM|nr:ribonuclease P protein component [Tahibacter amnicola]UXI68430.1 ribonuclease P protein component [Tahibacter amnicola]